MIEVEGDKEFNFEKIERDVEKYKELMLKLNEGL
jgi:hypothetical protein